MCAVEHESGDLLDREFRGEVFGSDFHGQSPVLILVEFAVFVEVFEGEAVLGDDFYAGGGGEAMVCPDLFCMVEMLPDLDSVQFWASPLGMKRADVKRKSAKASKLLNFIL